MFELWGRKRPVNGVGSPYEHIFNFDNEDYCFTALDTLDRNIYQEAMIVNNGSCVMYREFQKPMPKKLVKVGESW